MTEQMRELPRQFRARRLGPPTPTSTAPSPLPEMTANSAGNTATDEAVDKGWVHHESADGTGFEGWLYHYADGVVVSEDGTVHEYSQSGSVVGTTPEPQPEPEPEPEKPTAPSIPDFVEYVPSALRSYVLGTVLVLSSVAAVLTLFLVAPDPTFGGLLVVVLLGAVATVAGWALASWHPTVVSIRDGILEVTHGPQEVQFDLRDPETRVVLGKQPGSPSWKTTLEQPDRPTAVIGARQVKARHFTEIVEHHRSNLRGKSETAGDER